MALLVEGRLDDLLLRRLRERDGLEVSTLRRSEGVRRSVERGWRDSSAGKDDWVYDGPRASVRDPAWAGFERFGEPPQTS